MESLATFAKGLLNGAAVAAEALVEKLRYAFPAAVRCADDNDILPASIAAMRHGPVHAYLEPDVDAGVLRTPRVTS